MQVPVLPPVQDEAERRRRLEAQDFGETSYWRWVFVGGVLALAAFGLLAAWGLPGAGLVLVPTGLGMLIGSSIQLLLDR